MEKREYSIWWDRIFVYPFNAIGGLIGIILAILIPIVIVVGLIWLIKMIWYAV